MNTRLTTAGRVPALAVLGLLALVAAVSPAQAQSGLFSGVVYNDQGSPLRGATLRAENPNASLGSLTTTSDDNGRVNLIGLSSGQWSFRVEAPGFQPTSFSLEIRAASSRSRNPISIRLVRDPNVVVGGPLAGVDVRRLRDALQGAERAFAAGDYDGAIRGYLAALDRAPGLTHVMLPLGRAYRQKGDLTQAEQQFAALVAAEPTNASALQQLAEVRRDQGNTTEALGLFRRAATAEPHWSEPALQVGILARAQGDTRTAETFLRRAADAEPDSPQAEQARTLLAELSR